MSNRGQVIKTMILASGLFVSSLAIAADWLKVYDDDESTIYIDKNSIKVEGNMITHWHKGIMKGKPYYYLGYEIVSNMTYTYIDCNAKTYSYTIEIAYDKDSKPIYKKTNPLVMQPIPPGSVMEVISETVCKLAK